MKTDTVVIRAVKKDDATALNCVRTAPGVAKWIHAQPAETDQQTARLFFDGSEPIYTFVAEEPERGGVVGYVRLLVESNPRKRHIGRLSMAVIDHFQGRGIGGQLLDRVTDLAQNWLGLGKLQLLVLTGNEPAVKLYQSRHFEIEGLLKRELMVDGKLEDAYTMARFL
jgi:putative acetyltransferase